MRTTWITILFWSYLLFLVGADATTYNPADPDLWHRLALGEVLWKTGHFPAGDYFSYLSDYQYVADHEWGSAWIFYGLYQWGGESAIIGIKLGTLAITLMFLVWAGHRHRQPSALSAAFYALVLLALLPSFQSTVRCMTFTHIFFALWLYWYVCERQGRAISTLYYALTIIVWANLHGGFAIGLAWLFLVMALEILYGGPWQTWAIRLGVCTLATLVNPFGYQLWISTARALVTTRKGFPEWGPINWFHNLIEYPGYKVLLLLVVVALAVQIHRRGWRKMDQRLVLLIGLFGLISLSSARHTSLFAAVAGAFIPHLFQLDTPLRAFRNPLDRLGFMALASSLVLIPFYCALLIMPGDGFILRYTDAACPVAATDFLLGRNIRGNLLVPFNYGSYALWALRGKMRVSMDGRYDLVYLPKTYQRVDDFFYARGDWKTLLTTPAPNAILTPIADPIYSKLQAEPDWKEAWHDGTDAVFLPR